MQNTLKVTFLILFTGLFSSSNSLATQESTHTPSTYAISPTSTGKRDKFYASLGVYDGRQSLGFFFPQILRGQTWTCWWDTDWYGTGTGFRKNLNPDFFGGVYLYYDVPDEIIFSKPQSFDLSKRSPRFNLGFELSHTHFWQLTANLYHSFVDNHSFKIGYRTFQDKSGVSARISFHTFKNIVPFFGMAYTHGLQKEYRWSVKMNEGDLITAAIGAQYSINDYADLEWKVNIPELIKQFSEDEIILRPYYQQPIHVGIQLSASKSALRHKINQLPERYIPYHANAALSS